MIYRGKIAPMNLSLSTDSYGCLKLHMDWNRCCGKYQKYKKNRLPDFRNRTTATSIHM